ncbi:alpha/beta fold hydrolase [Antrihabitans sp. YC2-6]|uniref:alpha/beta hydrolase family protein n=1 Tax=Antrihabitans sp. YC2-6 TaxID=2799498 RepID=UPI0018F7699D|nr:alpha/beta fold hydrolase [Antrihabitans sp. YC2-6]MBJ8347785.1 alpha/beta fold hydrolase [Antrihabitans sp. YC2-6]
METVPIQLPDGTTSPVLLFPADEAHSHKPSPDSPRPVVVIVPGLGIPGGYYDVFAKELAMRGFDAAVCELRGQGDSRPRPSSESRYGYHELVSVDLPAMFEVVRERFPESTPYLLGHSMGGQLGVLYAARIRGRLGGLILVASGTPYFRGFGGAKSPGILVGSAAMSLTANIAGFWPGDRINLGGFGRQSKTLISDWSRLARTGRFDPEGADIDYEERISRLKLPVLSISIEGDDVAPASSATHLVGKLPNSDVTTWLQPEPLGHNGWIRKPVTTVDRITAWLHDR